EFNVLSRRVEEQRGTAPRLTDREIEVLRLVAKGMSNKDIAAELVIAQNTVKNHIRNILEKLQLRTRMEAALYAVRGQLIHPLQGGVGGGPDRGAPLGTLGLQHELVSEDSSRGRGQAAEGRAGHRARGQRLRARDRASLRRAARPPHGGVARARRPGAERGARH